MGGKSCCIRGWFLGWMNDLLLIRGDGIRRNSDGNIDRKYARERGGTTNDLESLNGRSRLLGLNKNRTE